MRKSMRFIAGFMSAIMLVNMIDLQVFANEAGDADGLYYIADADKTYDITPDEEPDYIVAELEEQREESTKQFLMSDHSVRAVVYAQPVHYMEDGKWEDIDNTLRYEGQTLDAVGGYVNTANDFQVRFAEETGLDTFISIRQGDYGMEWRYAEPNAETPSLPDEEQIQDAENAFETDSEPSEELPTETAAPEEAPNPALAPDPETDGPEDTSPERTAEAEMSAEDYTVQGMVMTADEENGDTAVSEPPVTGADEAADSPAATEEPVATQEPASTEEPADAEIPGVEETPASTPIPVLPTASPSAEQPEADAFPALQTSRITLLDTQAAMLSAGQPVSERSIEETVEQTMQEVTANVVYENALPDTDFQYQLVGKTLKENIVVHEMRESYVYAFEMSVQGLALSLEEQTGEIRAFDPDTQEDIFVIPAPVMYDAAGRSSHTVAYTLTQGTDGTYLLTITADSAWVNTADRAFPVSIDPAVATATKKSVQTTMVASRVPNENCSDRYEWFVGTSAYYYGECWALLHFDIPALNPGDVVIDAQMALTLRFKSFSDTSRDLQINAHAATSSWSREAVTWNTKPSYDSVVCDYDFVKTTDPSEGYTQKLFNITKAVRAWYAGTANNGIVLKPQTNTLENTGQFIPERNNNYPSGYYPYVVITYRNNKGVEPYWNYTTASAGTAGDMAVNDFSGNAVLTHTDAATSGLLMPVSVSHVYNGYMAGSNFTADSKFTDKLKPFAGYGWKLNLYQMVRPSSLYGLSGDSQTKWPYVYTDGDGTEHYFMKTSEGKFKDEDGLNLELKVITGGYTIGDDQGGLMTFDAKGNLTKIQDSNGNTATVTYTNGFITKITDGAGHVIALENDGTNLTKITDPTGKNTTYTYSSGLLTRISYPDGTHSDYTYDGDKALVSAQSKSGAKITLGYTSKVSGKRVSELQEYGTGGAAGQKLTFDYAEYNTTKIRSGGTDGAFGNNDDLITTLRFDNAGRATGTQVSTAGGVDLGASSSILTAASPNDSGSDIETLNRLSRSATIGQYTDNLAKSSSFEAMTGWQSTALGSAAQTAEVSSAEKYIGTSALKLTTTSCSGNAAGRVGQSFTNAVLKPGQTYTASAYVKVPSDIGSNGSNSYGAGIGAIITRTSSGTQNEYSEWVSRQTDTAINNGWRRVSVTFTVPQDATGTQIAMLLYNGTGTAYFDAVQVEEGDAANPYNLLQNSGMELDDGTNWFAVSTTSADGVTAEQAHSGSYSYKVTGDANVDLENNTFDVSEQLPFKVPPKTKVIEEMAPPKSNGRKLPITELARPFFLKQFAMQEAQREQAEKDGKPYYDNDLVVAKPDGSPISASWVSSQFGKLLEDLDMPHIRFHDLRHTAATNMHQLTGDFYTVGEVLGHTLAGIGVSLGLSMNFEAVTARYVDVRLERKKEVLDAYHGAVKQADPAKAEKAEPKKAKSAAKKKSSDLEL